jgi:hypothetical protein
MLPIETEIGHQAFALRVFLPELPELAQAEPGVLLLPDGEGLLADSELPAAAGAGGPGLDLASGAQDLFFRVSLPWHPRGLLSGVREPREG